MCIAVFSFVTFMKLELHVSELPPCRVEVLSE